VERQFLRCGVNIGDKLQTFMLQNPGRTAAWDASSAIGNAWVCWPQFVDRAIERDPDKPRLTDYNDLHLAEGLDRVREQLLAEVKAIIVARQFAEQIGKGVPAVEPAEKGGRKGKGGGGKNPPPELHYDWDTLFNRFTLIYPSETVWDAEREQIVKLQHVKIHFGTGIVNYWLGSPSRRTVNDVDVVFDPACKVDPKTSVNLFRGIKLKPDGAKSCDKLLELLRYLCREQDEHNTPVSDWVLKWMAYPLQNMGAKMQTAIVMHGEEGAGKNMFWGALAEIYGNYAGLINQFQLQTQFNDWISRKLFVIANEVLTRMEMKHLAGYLKNLVTEPVVPIETKNMPMRYEANHMQLVFLSNEIQPLLLGPSDRRYAVIKTPDTLPPAIYEAVAAELRDGGAAALYQYLLDLDLDGFKEQTRPPWTQAKSDLIELALTSPQSFWKDVSDGIVPLPYVPGDEHDWYQAYCIYCARTGEKNPAKLNKFSAEFRSMNGVKRVRGVRVKDPDRKEDELKAVSELKQRVVFYMGERPEGVTDDLKWLVWGMSEWRTAFRAWRSEGRPQSADDNESAF
jgi:putative DNA primase/helicase